MATFIEKMNRWQTNWKESGRMSIAAALATEACIAFWIVYTALFILETLLPTFVTVRLSLTTYLAWLLSGTLATLWLRHEASDSVTPVRPAIQRFFMIVTALGIMSILALSLSRFPLLAGAIFWILSLTLTFLLWRQFTGIEK